MEILHDWGKNKYGNLKIKREEIQKHLAKVKNKIPPDEVDLQTIKDKEKELDEVIRLEELWWSQRAKVKWLKEGDMNTKYFHQKASQRKRKNWIGKINDENGNQIDSDMGIQEVFTKYFKDIFKSSNT